MPAFPISGTPEGVIFVGTFRTATGQLEHTVSSRLLRRDTVSLRECCESEVTPECVQMCSAKNMAKF